MERPGRSQVQHCVLGPARLGAALTALSFETPQTATLGAAQQTEAEAEPADQNAHLGCDELDA
jgi:hypothetical protein